MAFQQCSYKGQLREVVSGESDECWEYAEYGTPFCGKEGWQENRRVPVEAICFIEKSPANRVEPMKPLDAAMRMLKENWCVPRSCAAAVMKLYIDMSDRVRFYRVYCNMDPDAAKTVYESISEQGMK